MLWYVDSVLTRSPLCIETMLIDVSPGVTQITITFTRITCSTANAINVSWKNKGKLFNPQNPLKSLLTRSGCCFRPVFTALFFAAVDGVGEATDSILVEFLRAKCTLQLA